jgi:hypothetical protein
MLIGPNGMPIPMGPNGPLFNPMGPGPGFMRPPMPAGGGGLRPPHPAQLEPSACLELTVRRIYPCCKQFPDAACG